MTSHVVKRVHLPPELHATLPGSLLRIAFRQNPQALLQPRESASLRLDASIKVTNNKLICRIAL